MRPGETLVRQPVGADCGVSPALHRDPRFGVRRREGSRATRLSRPDRRTLAGTPGERWSRQRARADGVPAFGPVRGRPRHRPVRLFGDVRDADLRAVFEGSSHAPERIERCAGSLRGAAGSRHRPQARGRCGVGSGRRPPQGGRAHDRGERSLAGAGQGIRAGQIALVSERSTSGRPACRDRRHVTLRTRSVRRRTPRPRREPLREGVRSVRILRSASPSHSSQRSRCAAVPAQGLRSRLPSRRGAG